MHLDHHVLVLRVRLLSSRSFHGMTLYRIGSFKTPRTPVPWFNGLRKNWARLRNRRIEQPQPNWSEPHSKKSTEIDQIMQWCHWLPPNSNNQYCLNVKVQQHEEECETPIMFQSEWAIVFFKYVNKPTVLFHQKDKTYVWPKNYPEKVLQPCPTASFLFDNTNIFGRKFFLKGSDD